jgi:hypothetical protein
MNRKPRPRFATDARWSIQERRLALWIGAGVAAVLILMALWPISKTSIDFRAVRMSPSDRAGSTAFRETRWYELGPKGWDPYKEARELRRNGNGFSDTDPRAAELLKHLRDIWDNAPINPSMDGAAIRIPGYVVPIERGKDGVTEFLLVPYFGACIHTPPPPSNQILRVTAASPIQNLRTMDNVWVSGRLKAATSDSPMGRSSYSMQIDAIEPYRRKEE